MSGRELRTGYAIELQLVTGGLVALWHNPETLHAHMTRAWPGTWCNLWPGVNDEQIFHRCGNCQALMALPVALQARYIIARPSARPSASA